MIVDTLLAAGLAAACVVAVGQLAYVAWLVRGDVDLAAYEDWRTGLLDRLAPHPVPLCPPTVRLPGARASRLRVPGYVDPATTMTASDVASLARLLDELAAVGA